MTMIVGLRVLIFVLMCVATVLFAIFAFKSRKLSKLYSPNFGGRPDIARTQREKHTDAPPELSKMKKPSSTPLAF
jgi:hypothetical protein